MIRILESRDAAKLLRRRAARMNEAEQAVRPILEDVRTKGDKALLDYARKFDGLKRKSVSVPREDLAAAAGRLSAEFRRAAKTSAANVRAYAKLQMPQAKRLEPAPGLKLSQIVRPLDTVAAYIPAGRYPLPSTVIMTVVPAVAAGVENILVCAPKAVDGIF